MPWVQVFCTSANTGAGFLHTRCRFLRVPRNPTRTRTPYTRGKNPHRLPIPVPITCWDWAAVVALFCLSHASDTPDVAFACWISLYSLQRLSKKRALLLVSMFARPLGKNKPYQLLTVGWKVEFQPNTYVISQQSSNHPSPSPRHRRLFLLTPL
jgi:hypothetical protein